VSGVCWLCGSLSSLKPGSLVLDPSPRLSLSPACPCPQQWVSLLQGFLPLEGEWRVLAWTTSKVLDLLVLFPWSYLLPGFLLLKGERSFVARAATK
jgi:hypothetical protein